MEEATEEKRKADEAEERWKVDENQKTEEVEEWRKNDEKYKAAKALTNQIVAGVEEHWRSEAQQRPSSSKAVVPQPIGGLLLSDLMAHQIALEVT